MAQDRSNVEEAWPGDIIGLHNHGTIKIGEVFDLPPSPLGLDSDKPPYLQLSKDIAVIDNAYSLAPLIEETNS